MATDIVFDQAQFKNHLDEIYRGRIVEDAYTQRPVSRTESPQPSPIGKSGEGAGGVLPSLTLDGPTDLTPDFYRRPYDSVRRTKPGAEAQTDIAKAQEARDLAAQKELLAHPEELRRLFPEMLKKFDLTHHGYLDQHDIAKGLARGSLTDLERNYLTVLGNGYDGILRDSRKVAPGIQEYDLARIEKAMNRSLPEDPIWAEDSRVWVPHIFLVSGLVVSAVSMKAVAKEPLIFGAAFLGVFGFTEACLLYNHVSGIYSGAYDDIERNYRAFVDRY